MFSLRQLTVFFLATFVCHSSLARFMSSLQHESKRSLLIIKRGQTPDQVPDGIKQKTAYVAADVDSARQIDAGTLQVEKFVADLATSKGYAQCNKLLEAYLAQQPPDVLHVPGYGGASYVKSTSTPYMYEVKCVCCVTTKNYETDHTIGSVVQDLTSDLIKNLGWTLQEAQSDAHTTASTLKYSGGGGGGGSGSGGKGGGGGGGGHHNGTTTKHTSSKHTSSKHNR